MTEHKFGLTGSDEKNPVLLTAKHLSLAWTRYVALFGEPPHGTERQMAALFELVKSTTTLEAK